MLIEINWLIDLNDRCYLQSWIKIHKSYTRRARQYIVICVWLCAGRELTYFLMQIYILSMCCDM